MNDAWPNASDLGHALPIGTRVGEVEITGLIGEGGFGIVYLAHDPSLQRRVAVKEYMPSSLASRRGGGFEVSVKSERHRETFDAGLKSFVNEARLLARFEHPALVKVYRFWQANGTAYMMMPYYEGPTLKAELDRRGRPPDEATLRGWLLPLLDALESIHASNCFHRDIAPDNIILTANGPLLLDFGAARRVIGDMTQALTVVLKPGYAPIEQYGESARMQQGAWTDLYALGCVLHYAITGRAPMSSVERLMDDALAPLSRVAAGAYGPDFLRAVDAVLALRPQHRPQDVAQFRALLGADPASPAPPPPPVTKPVEIAAGPVSNAPTVRSSADDSAPRPTSASGSGSGSGSGWTIGVVLVLAAGVSAAAWFANHRRPPSGPIGRAASSAAIPHEEAASPASAVVVGTPAAGASLPMIMPTSPPATAAAPPRAAPVPTHRLPETRPAPPIARQATPPAASPIAKPAPLARCSEILQKASLEALSADEAAFLKRECR